MIPRIDTAKTNATIHASAAKDVKRNESIERSIVSGNMMPAAMDAWYMARLHQIESGPLWAIVEQETVAPTTRSHRGVSSQK